MYYNGISVSQDYQEALKWFRLAANQGYAGAQSSIGVMYAKGEGVSQNYEEALKWFRLAAEQGIASTQAVLAAMYYDGKGVPQDYIQAHKWLNLAASQATGKDAERYRSIKGTVAKQMTAEQIAEAQRLAREWQPQTGRQPENR